MLIVFTRQITGIKELFLQQKEKIKQRTCYRLWMDLFFLWSPRYSTIGCFRATKCADKCGTEVCGFAFAFERLQIATILYSSCRSLIYFPPYSSGVEGESELLLLLHNALTTTTTHIHLVTFTVIENTRIGKNGKPYGTTCMLLHAYLFVFVC